MTVRAKFHCNSVTRSMGNKKNEDTGQWEPCVLWSVDLSPVYANDDPTHENSKFWNATPSGKFEMNMIFEDAADQFEPGREYYIDITPAA